jgi:GDPmannose 4,6-dehydratase
MHKKVIITGVTGQDGSYMVDLLLEETDYEIFGMVRRASTNNYHNIKHLLDNTRFKLITGDLTDSQSIDNIVRDTQPDYFINLAAQSFVGASWQIPEQTFDIDAVGVIRCLEAIRKHAPNCRFYNAGSSEELGNVDYSPQDEKHPLKPRSPYGAAKAAARHIVKVYRESYHLYAIQGLLYNHESERRGEEFVTRKITKNIARIKKALDNNEKFEPLELGNIDAKRDWSHAKDFVRGIWMMLNQEKYNKNFPIIIGGLTEDQERVHNYSKNIKEYILSSGEAHTVREFVESAFKSAGINGNWSFAGTVGNYAPPENEVFRKDTGELLMRINPIFYRPAEVDLLLGDSTEARLKLNWVPEISFDNLVGEMVNYDLQNINIV